jgi:thiosulfate reductase/polysulfide reductase chain A
MGTLSPIARSILSVPVRDVQKSQKKKLLKIENYGDTMGKRLTRRQFIRIAGLSAAGAAVLPFPLNILGGENTAGSAASAMADGLYPTYCEICFWKCAGMTHVQNGEPVKVIGNSNDPLCNGRLCPRGTGGIGMYTDEDRLKTPLIRVEKDGKQTFREASWDEALDLIASRLTNLKEKYGPECTALFTHGSGGKFWGNFLKAYGSNSITAPSYAQCRGPREEAFFLTFGDIIGSPERTDIENSKCLVLIGSHLGENMHNGQVQEFSNMQANGGSVITVDPRFSVAASKSKYWLPIRPATDNALLLAWINVIISEELYDKDYVANYTLGFEELKAHVAQMTPEWAAPITALDPKQIRETAREMAKNAPATIIHPGRHVTWYGDDTQRLRAVAILNGLLGSWGARGGFYLPQKAEVKDYPLPKFPEPSRNWKDAFPDKYPLANEVLANGICDATIVRPEGDCSFKAWIVNGTNLMSTLPNRAETLKAINDLEFMVVIDTMPAEITGYADVVLPECTYLERYDDLRISQHREPTVALRMPAAKPKYNSKPGWWMAKSLAERMGLGHYFPYKHIEEYLDYRLKSIGSSLAEMQKIGVKKLPVREHIYFADDLSDFFVDTDSGKIEFYSPQLAELGYDPIPVYTPHAQPEAGYYRLIYGRTPTHTFGRTMNNPLLYETMKENNVWIHPSVAKLWGIENNQYIQLINQDGVKSNKVKAYITERIRHDSIYMAHGFGQRDARQKRSYLKGASDSELITKYAVDPIMGGTGMRINFVTFKTEGVA